MYKFGRLFLTKTTITACGHATSYKIAASIKFSTSYITRTPATKSLNTLAQFKQLNLSSIPCRFYTTEQEEPQETNTVTRRVKKSTNITGLPVIPEGRAVLIELYIKIQRELTRLAPEFAYRWLVADLIQKRLDILTSEEDYEKIEEKIGHGQIEEMIEAAHDELSLIPLLAEWKMWEFDPEERGVPTLINPRVLLKHSQAVEELKAYREQALKIVKDGQSSQQATQTTQAPKS